MAVTINGSTGISGVDGSAGTPALIGSDADTGIFLAAGQVSASVNGIAGNVPLVSGTAQASTSGTAIDFTSIPSWVKRITVMFSGVSLSGSSHLLVQIGSGSVSSSGYTSSAGYYNFSNATNGLTSSSGFAIGVGAAATVVTGMMHICAITSTIWVSSHSVASGSVGNGGGVSPTLSGTLDRIRITTVNGTDTFDAGSINILYE